MANTNQDFQYKNVKDPSLVTYRTEFLDTSYLIHPDFNFDKEVFVGKSLIKDCLILQQKAFDKAYERVYLPEKERQEYNKTKEKFYENLDRMCLVVSSFLAFVAKKEFFPDSCIITFSVTWGISNEVCWNINCDTGNKYLKSFRNIFINLFSNKDPQFDSKIPWPIERYVESISTSLI